MRVRRHVWIAGAGLALVACVDKFTVRGMAPQPQVYAPGDDWTSYASDYEVPVELADGKCAGKHSEFTVCLHPMSDAERCVPKDAKPDKTCADNADPRTISATLHAHRLKVHISDGRCPVPRVNGIDVALDRLRSQIQGCIKGDSDGRMTFENLRRSLPGTFDDTLGDAYGIGRPVDPKHPPSVGRWVDLQPGMRLRIDNANYIQRPQLKSRFATAGVQYYSIGQSWRRADGAVRGKLTFDPLVALFASPLEPSAVRAADDLDAGCALDDAGERAGTGARLWTSASSVLDLEAKAYGYWRIVYPTALLPPETPRDSASPNYDVALIGTDDVAFQDSLAHSECVQAACNNPTTDAGATRCPSADHVCFFFFGRTALVPEIRIIVRGSPTFVSVGTTFRDVLLTWSDADPADFLPDTLRFERLRDGKYYEVLFRSNQTSDVYDLPLMKGDKISW